MLGPDEVLKVRQYLSGQKQVVVERDDGNVTPAELKQHWPEVLSAIQKELETWVEHNCISRKKRSEARNVIDVRWVYKWKMGCRNPLCRCIDFPCLEITARHSCAAVLAGIQGHAG